MYKVTELALNEVGYLEKSKDSYKKYGVNALIPKTKYAGMDNYTIYGKEMHDLYPKVMDFPAYWCDAFVDDMFYRAYGVTNAQGLIGGFDDYTKGSIQLYKNMGAFFLKGAKVPEEGDQVFFSKDGKLSGVNHTGLVWKVDSSYIYTVEGNATANSDTNNGGGVVQRVYLLTADRIYGYGRPNYAKYEQLSKWVQTGDTWYYYRDGQKVKREWVDYKGLRYRLGINGEMLTDWHQIYDADGELQWYYFDSEGALWCDTGKGDGSLERMAV